MKNNRSERDRANQTYFISLVNSRASLRNLPLMSFMAIVLLGLASFMPVATVYFEGHQELLPLFYVHLGIIGFSVLVLVLTPLRSLVFRFQVVSSGLVAVFSVIWVYSLCFGAISIATAVQTPLNTTYNFALLPTFVMVGLLYVCVAFSVHILLLRKRLDRGHSAQRTLGNLISASSVYRSKSLWIIFGVTVIGSNALTQGKYMTLTFGVLLFLLFASAATSLPVEFGYLTYLKYRDKEYWEQRPPKIVVSRVRKVATRKKIGKWVLIILAVVVGIGVLNEVLPRIL